MFSRMRSVTINHFPMTSMGARACELRAVGPKCQFLRYDDSSSLPQL